VTVELKVQPVLIFDGGKLSIKRSGYPNNGDGVLLFNDDEMKWDHGHDSEHIFRFVSIAKSELLAIRDFLNAEFPIIGEMK
jgi:hypothetical protein